MENIEAHIKKDKEILQDQLLIHKCAVILKVNCMTWKSMSSTIRKRLRQEIITIQPI